MQKSISTLILSATMLLGCNNHDQRFDLAQVIEQKFSKANPDKDIKRYARYYKLNNGSVRAVFIVNEGENNNAIAEECHQTKQTTFPCNDKDFGFIETGQSRWFDTDQHFPLALDAGCDFVDLEYNLELRKLTKMECSGAF